VHIGECGGRRGYVSVLACVQQVASNQKGITLLSALCEEYTKDVVQAYMLHIRVCICAGVCSHICMFVSYFSGVCVYVECI